VQKRYYILVISFYFLHFEHYMYLTCVLFFIFYMIIKEPGKLYTDLNRKQIQLNTLVHYVIFMRKITNFKPTP